MRYKVLFTFLLALFSSSATAQWEKINDLDYTWGPFKIYNITLFTESGEYFPHIRPLMLSLKYDKPVDGRDFAISIARSWASLDIKLPEQNKIIDRLRKTLPDLKDGDKLSYIALEDRGYFIVNNQIIGEEFPKEVSDAIVAVWLDPRVDLSHKIVVKKVDNVQAVHIATYNLPDTQDPTKENLNKLYASEVLQSFALKQATFAEKALKQPAIGVPMRAIVEPKATEEAPTPTPEQKPQDPENPEQEIRPIEDPMPDNKRAS